ncbi:protein gar2 [Diachasma alloeum]|uniref:protein gar2 n=1 Tax=Diachasma alloeum TaxID=454923 RepID=UPI00073836A5|nr:protein gar2 [Diachasma alloeum]
MVQTRSMKRKEEQRAERRVTREKNKKFRENWELIDLVDSTNEMEEEEELTFFQHTTRDDSDYPLSPGSSQIERASPLEPPFRGFSILQDSRQTVAAFDTIESSLASSEGDYQSTENLTSSSDVSSGVPRIPAVSQLHVGERSSKRDNLEKLVHRLLNKKVKQELQDPLQEVQAPLQELQPTAHVCPDSQLSPPHVPQQPPNTPDRNSPARRALQGKKERAEQRIEPEKPEKSMKTLELIDLVDSMDGKKERAEQMVKPEKPEESMKTPELIDLIDSMDEVMVQHNIRSNDHRSIPSFLNLPFDNRWTVGGAPRHSGNNYRWGFTGAGNHHRPRPAPYPQLYSCSKSCADQCSADETMRSVFVGNIAHKATEEDLWTIFGQIGPLDSVRLIYDRKIGRASGFGFVAYKDQETALKAIQSLNGYELRGKMLIVDKANEKKSKISKVSCTVTH